jgi:putative membrane protein
VTEQPRTEAQAQSAPVQGADGAPGAQWRRLSPRMLLVHPVRELIRYIPVLAGAFFAGRNSDNGQWWSLIGVALVIGLSVVRWATTRFRITPDQVQLRTGLLRKRTIAAPADRVRSVDVTAHTLHRVLGLAKVSIGTGTYDRKKEGLVLDGLAAPQAAELRAELLHRGQSIRGPALRGPQPTNAVPDGRPINTVPDGQPINAVPEEQELVRQDPAWLRFAPFTLSGLITGLAILGFGWNALQQSHVDAGRLGPVQSASRHLSDTPLWLLVVQLLVGALVVISLLSVAGYLLSYYGFRLTRHTGGTLQVTRGLLTSRATSIEQTRLRGVELSEPLLLRAAGGLGAALSEAAPSWFRRRRDRSCTRWVSGSWTRTVPGQRLPIRFVGMVRLPFGDGWSAPACHGSSSRRR